MTNNITTLGIPIINTSRMVKIESKQIKSQCVPYFFTANEHTKKNKENSQNKNNIIIK